MIELPKVAVLPDWSDFTPEALTALSLTIQVNENALSAEYASVPRYLQWWGVIVAEIKNTMKLVNLELKEKQADWDKQVREMLAVGGVKVTEKLIQSEMERLDEYKKAHRQIWQVESIYTKAVAYENALIAKQKSIEGLGFQKRHEETMTMKAARPQD